MAFSPCLERERRPTHSPCLTSSAARPPRAATTSPCPASVTIPAGAASAVIAVTPVDDPFSEPNETVTVTLNLNPSYTPGSPSQALVTIVSEDLPPDLIVAALTVPATGVPGSPVIVNDTTKNQSTGTAAPTSTAFYLSTNVLPDAADPLLGTRAVPALQAGLSSVASTTFTIPPTTPTGTYYVIAKADSAAAITETNESNNTKFSGAIRIGPDFDMDSFSVPAGAGAGTTISVTDNTKNIRERFGGRVENRDLLLGQRDPRRRGYAAREPPSRPHPRRWGKCRQHLRADTRGHGDRHLVPLCQSGCERRGYGDLRDQQCLLCDRDQDRT